MQIKHDLPQSKPAPVAANNGIAYLLWFAFCFGMGGMHRLYLGKPISGILYLCTFGFFGIGQLIDLLLIPNMVDEKNLRYRALHGSPYSDGTPTQVVVNVGEGYAVDTYTAGSNSTPAAPAEPLDVRLLRVCRDLGGATLSDGVIETGVTTKEIKDCLHQLCVEGLLAISNREADGAVIYRAI